VRGLPSIHAGSVLLLTVLGSVPANSLHLKILGTPPILYPHIKFKKKTFANRDQDAAFC